MKLITFSILLMFVPGFVMAQEPAATADTSSSTNEQAASPPDHSQRHIASGTPAGNIPIELNALLLYGSAGFVSKPDLISGTKQTYSPEHGIIEDWREQMLKTISMYVGPRQQDPLQVNRMLTDDELDSRANEGRTIMRLVLKETLKFSKERIAEIDRLAKALKYEVSTDKTADEETGAETNDIKTTDRKITGKMATDRMAGAAHPIKNAVVNDKVVIKTGLRVRIDSGKPGLVSETEARYGKALYFYKLNLDNQGDNSLGFRFILGRNGTLITLGTPPPGTSQAPTSFNSAADFKKAGKRPVRSRRSLKGPGYNSD
jgi:hypothetical protein